MWITPTIATLQAHLSGPEYEALRSAARAAGQSADSLTTDSLARSVATVRGYVGARHTLGLEGTIPDELESALGCIWRYEYITRLPNSDRLLDDRRLRAWENAIATLKDVSAGRFAIVPPTSPAEDAMQAGGPGFEQVVPSRRANDTTALDGLL